MLAPARVPVLPAIRDPSRTPPAPPAASATATHRRSPPSSPAASRRTRCARSPRRCRAAAAAPRPPFPRRPACPSRGSAPSRCCIRFSTLNTSAISSTSRPPGPNMQRLRDARIEDVLPRIPARVARKDPPAVVAETRLAVDVRLEAVVRARVRGHERVHRRAHRAVAHECDVRRPLRHVHRVVRLPVERADLVAHAVARSRRRSRCRCTAFPSGRGRSTESAKPHGRFLVAVIVILFGNVVRRDREVARSASEPSTVEKP